MSNPKVSIILPIYNVEGYLQECLESVTRQTLQDIEIICVNDGSKDGSLTIINRFADRDDRIVVLDGPNGGYGKAMNRGLARATGEYIGIVEPDDYVSLAMYEDLYQAASDNNLDFVKADFYRFTRASNGNMRLVYNHLDKTAENYNQVFDPSMRPDTLTFIMNTWSGIYKRSFLEEHGIKHHETPGASFQDNGFWFQTFAYGKRAMILDRPYYYNRRDNPNSSVKDTGKVYCMSEEYDYIEDLIKRDPVLWERFKYMCWRKRYDNYNATLNRIDPAFVPEFVQHVKTELERAQRADELEVSVYSEKQWSDMMLILRDSDAFVQQALADKQKAVAKKKNAKKGNGAKESQKKKSVVERGVSKMKRTARKLLK